MGPGSHLPACSECQLLCRLFSYQLWNGCCSSSHHIQTWLCAEFLRSGKAFLTSSPVPFLWWLELPTFRVITDKLGCTLALGRGSPSPQSCLGKAWRRPVSAELNWSSASKEEERVGIGQAAGSVCRRQSLLPFTSFLTLGRGCDFLHLVPALCSVSLCLALVTWYCYSIVIFHGVCWYIRKLLVISHLCSIFWYLCISVSFHVPFLE